MKLKVLEPLFSICKIAALPDINALGEFVFLSRTDEEISLVCQTNCLPETTLTSENGWRTFRIEGILDFSLTGILSKISRLLAEQDIGIFAVSTFQTDYILLKEENLALALATLTKAGYSL